MFIILLAQHIRFTVAHCELFLFTQNSSFILKN